MYICAEAQNGITCCCCFFLHVLNNLTVCFVSQTAIKESSSSEVSLLFCTEWTLGPSESVGRSSTLIPLQQFLKSAQPLNENGTKCSKHIHLSSFINIATTWRKKPPIWTHFRSQISFSFRGVWVELAAKQHRESGTRSAKHVVKTQWVKAVKVKGGLSLQTVKEQGL